MISKSDSLPQQGHSTELGTDFVQRLEASLRSADREKRRLALLKRMRRILPALLLVGPILAWRLILASPGSAHLAIDMLAWLTFALDVGVHVDTSILSYLGLQALPSVVGVLLLILTTGWLLSFPTNQK